MITNPMIAAAQNYHRLRAGEEEERATAAVHDHARMSHAQLRRLHLEQIERLQQIRMIRAEVRERVG